MSTGDEWDDEPAPHERTPQPGITRAAAVLWIVMAVVFYLFGCLNLVTNAVLNVQRPNRANGTEGCSVWLSFGIGCALLVAGRNLIRGKSKDVVGASVLSILLGLFYGAIAVASVLFLAGNAGLALILGGVSVVIAVGCVLPGVLALAGRSRYLAWRAAERERRRWGRDEEEEYDDEDEDDRGPERRPWDRGRR